MPLPFDAALREILSSPSIDVADIEDRCVACNLSHDTRISLDRAQELYDYHSQGVDPHPKTGRALRDSVKDHFYRRIRTSRNPDYVRPHLNRQNFVRMATGLRPDGLNPSLPLARVLDLTGLGKVYLWAEQRSLPGFRGYETELRDKGAGIYFKARFEHGEQRAQEFVGQVLDAMDRRRKHVPFEPAWAVRWRDFEPYRSDRAEKWLAVLGMPNLHTDRSPRCLILLKYTLSAASVLVRPTQLDADWFPLHFPSPPHSGPEKGGHPMDLSLPPPQTDLLSEFIHQQMRHEPADWTGEVRFTLSRNHGELRRQRAAHHGRLMHFNNGLRRNEWIGGCLDGAETA
jgi:hypothetical protein